MTSFVVGGDVGGTNSRLALYSIPAAELALHEGKQ
jgi:glucokinase